MVEREREIMDTVISRQKRWLGHILRHDSLLRITLEWQMQGKKTYGRPRTMLLGWLLKTEEGNISYEELKMSAQDRSRWSQWRWKPAIGQNTAERASGLDFNPTLVRANIISPTLEMYEYPFISYGAFRAWTLWITVTFYLDLWPLSFIFIFILWGGTLSLRMPTLRPALQAGPMRNPREGTSVVLRDTIRLTWWCV